MKAKPPQLFLTESPQLGFLELIQTHRRNIFINFKNITESYEYLFLLGYRSMIYYYFSAHVFSFN